jgi:hypothetical protein
LLNKNTYSSALLGRSRTLSGKLEALIHGIRDRRIQPLACIASAKRDGISRRFFAGRPLGSGLIRVPPVSKP